MLPYNIVCVGLSAVSTFYLFYGAWLGDHMYSYKENDAVIYGMAMYTISKNVELLDTVFMILRHKYRQVSFLHVSIVRWLFILMFEIVVCMHRFFRICLSIKLLCHETAWNKYFSMTANLDLYSPTGEQKWKLDSLEKVWKRQFWRSAND